jgi:uncharacterized membrane protein YccC
MTLSRKAKEAIKTALAMTLSYAISMRIGWDKPMWAAFAVAVISLSTIGQSLSKSVMRMLGTLIAVIFSLIFIALFPQQRWLFMIALSSYIGFCTYMMGGSKNKYFWHVCGFVCVIICMSSGPNSANAFQIAMLRAQETGLGILVYSLVSIFLWPKSSRNDFMGATRKLASTQHALCRVYLNLIRGQEGTDEIQTLRKQAVGQQALFNKLLDAAEIDSYEVWELRQQWRRYQHQIMELGELLSLMYNRLTEARTLDLKRLCPNVTVFCIELEQRLNQIKGMFSDQKFEKRPAIIDLTLDMDQIRSLSHFEKAAFAVIQKRLQRLEALSRSMFETVTGMKGFAQVATRADTTASFVNGFILDPDRVASVIRAMVTVWLAYLAWIYIDSIPGGVGFVIMASIFGMAMASMPQIPVSILFLPNVIAVLSAGIIYILVMPKLASFRGLGVLIFTFTFIICYLFASPKQALGRIFGLTMFIAITSISNVQNYNFLAFANTALMFPLGFSLLVITAYIPFSPQPERAFMRLQKRFFCSCDYLVSIAQSDQNAFTILDRFRKNFHIHEIFTLPEKLAAWAPHVGSDTLTMTSPQHVQALVTNFKMLSSRMQELLKASDGLQKQFPAEELNAEIRDWQGSFKKAFRSISDNPAAGKQQEFIKKMAKITERLEACIKKIFGRQTEQQFNKQQSEHFYCLMGAYLSLSESLVEYAGDAGEINWPQWQEERFW